MKDELIDSYIDICELGSLTLKNYLVHYPVQSEQDDEQDHIMTEMVMMWS